MLLYITLVGNSVLKVEHWLAWPYTYTGSGRNGNEAVALQAFARWLHYRYTPSNCHRRGNIVSARDTMFATSLMASICVSVRLHISQTTKQGRISPHFKYMFPVAVARSSAWDYLSCMVVHWGEVCYIRSRCSCIVHSRGLQYYIAVAETQITTSPSSSSSIRHKHATTYATAAD